MHWYYEIFLVLLLINLDWYCHLRRWLLILRLGLPVFLGSDLLYALLIYIYIQTTYAQTTIYIQTNFCFWLAKNRKYKVWVINFCILQYLFRSVNPIWRWWIVFAEWLTDERRLVLFPAGIIVRDPHHRESPTRREQGPNLRRTQVQA